MASELRLAVAITAIDRFSKTFDKAQAKGDGLAKSLGAGFMSGGALLGLSAITSAVNGIASAMQASIGQFLEFDRNIARVQAVTQTTAAEIKPFSDFVRGLGETTQFTATQIAAAAETLTVAGLTLEEQTGGALEGVLNLALAGGVGIQEAAKIAIGAIKGMGLEFSELDRVNGVLVATFQSTATTISDLGAALSYLAPVGRAAGMDIEDLSAAIGILGDAGYRGTVAGTGLRQAIAKMLAPSSDARKVMARLGLSFGVLSPEAQSAEQSLFSVAKTIDSLQSEVRLANTELQEMSELMGNLSIEQTKNSIKINKIRLRASKQQRALTDAEEYRISRLQNANSALGIQQQEYSIIQQQTQMKATKLNSELTTQQSSFNDLNAIVENGTQTLLPFTQVIERLQSSGATTAEIMEIFGVRGGQAIFGLMANATKLKTLTESLFDPNIAQRADDFAKVVGEAASGQVRILESAVTELQIAMGEELMEGLQDLIPILVEEIIPAFKDDLIPLLRELAPLFVEMIPLIKAMAYLFVFLAHVVAAFAGGNWWVILASLAGLMIGLYAGFKLAMATGPFGMGTALALGAIGATIGAAMAMGIQNSLDDGGMDSAAGAEPNVALATGGVVKSPTIALVGEAGAEAVIPLNNGAVPVQMTGNTGGEAGNANMFKDSNVEVNIVTGLGPFGYLVSSIMDDTTEWNERTGHRNRSNLRTVS